MGTTHYAFVGPYLRCTQQLKDVEDGHRGCVNEGCPKYRLEFGGMTAKFCPQCGKEIGTFTTTRKESAVRGVWELFGGKDTFRPVMCEDGPKSIRSKYDILVPNYRPGYDPDCEDEDTRRQFRVAPRDGSTYQEMSSMNPGEEMAWLLEKYAAEIEKLRGLYGADNVKVCWGFLTWGN